MESIRTKIRAEFVFLHRPLSKAGAVQEHSS